MPGLNPDRQWRSSRWISASVSKRFPEICCFKGPTGSRRAPDLGSRVDATTFPTDSIGSTHTCLQQCEEFCTSSVDCCLRFLHCLLTVSNYRMNFHMGPCLSKHHHFGWLARCKQGKATPSQSSFRKHCTCGFSHELIHVLNKTPGRKYLYYPTFRTSLVCSVVWARAVYY